MKTGKKRRRVLVLLFSFVIAASMLMSEGVTVFAGDAEGTPQQTEETVKTDEPGTAGGTQTGGQEAAGGTQTGGQENADGAQAGGQENADGAQTGGQKDGGNAEQQNGAGGEKKQPAKAPAKGGTAIEDAKTLQAAIDEAENGGTIELEKDIALDSPVSVAGKSITITSKSGSTYSLSVGENDSSGELIKVASGAGLTLKNITLDGGGKKLSGAMIDDAGTLVFESGTTVKDGVIAGGSSGAIRVSGSGASFTMNGGSITGMKPYESDSQIWYSGTVLVTDGARFTMNGGEIARNSWDRGTEWSAVYCTSGVFVNGNATVEMNGGSISGNTADRGSAMHIYHGNVTINGGTISDNKGVQGYGYSPYASGGYCCGAVMVNGGSSLTVTGGTFSGNTSSHAGGAITVAYDGTNEPAFRMTGGTITGNTAEHVGGGIYIYSNNAEITGGRIENNSSGRLGGGIYVEGNSKHYTTTKMSNVLVTGNSADRLGGGIWICPTGSFRADASESVAVFDNSVAGDGAGSDVASVKKSMSSATLSLANRMLGGGKVTYYKDGEVQTSVYGIPDSSSRFDASNPGDPVDVSGRRDGLALKAVPVSDDAKSLARNSARLVITGNTAKYGGGIGANGGVEIGGGGTQKVVVKKVWDSSIDKSDIPENIVVDILSNGSKIDEVTLNEGNSWTKEITDISSESGNITAREHSYAGFTPSYDVQKVDGGYEITITNKKDEPTPEPEPETTELSVQKVWKNDTEQDRPASIKVQLLRDGEAYGDPVELSADNSWQHSWSGLDKSYDWSVEEVEVPEGYNSVTSHDGNSWIITNTKTTPEKPGGDNPRPVTPDEPTTPTKPSGGNGRTVNGGSGNTVVRRDVRTPGGYVRTGDSKEALVYTIAFTAAAAGAIYVSIRRRRKGAER